MVEAGEEDDSLLLTEVVLVEEGLGVDGAEGVELGFTFFGPVDEGVFTDVKLLGALGVCEAIGAEG